MNPNSTQSQPPETTAVLLIAHGSRRASANDDLVRLADMLRSRGRAETGSQGSAVPAAGRPESSNAAPPAYQLVEIAYLEVTEPTIPQAARACIQNGAGRVLMLPYFLSAGEHVVTDLEHHRQQLAAEFPGVTFRLCPPLGLHPAILDIVLDRLAEGAER